VIQYLLISFGEHFGYKSLPFIIQFLSVELQ